MSIAAHLAEIQERMAQAARRAHRAADEVRLMAVSKMQTVESILEAIDAGQQLFGENRVQEFAAKHEELGLRATGAKFHLIGHLQSNKAKKAVELFAAIDSVDSLRLAESLSLFQLSRVNGQRERLEVLIEINIGGEASKEGIDPDSPELTALVAAQRRLQGIAIRGLMAVPPWSEEPEHSRPYFRRLRELRDRLQETSGVELPELSMGMSNDFEVAIEEGSTCVRVGTAIFGRRRPAQVEESKP
jgi:pyridoxal phosphate enzyme (YggS family)